AAQRQLAAQGFYPVDEPDDPGTPRRIGPAVAVVIDRKAQRRVLDTELHVDDGCVRVLRRVGQRLGHDVVGGDLYRLGQPADLVDVQHGRQTGAPGERAERRAQATLGQDRRMDTAGDLAELVEDADELVA